MEPTMPMGNGFKLGPRIPLNPEGGNEMHGSTNVFDMKFPSRIFRREKECTSENANLCEKPVNTDALKLPIALGVVIPVVAIVVVLLYLHRRNVRQEKKEDVQDPNKGLDFGLDGGKKRKSKFGLGGEKTDSRAMRQLSMDLNMSTPYLLPPQLQSSRESLHSLARSIHNNEDPYRPVGQYSDNASIRSGRTRGPGGEQASVYTTSTKSGGRDARGLPIRQNSLPQSPPAAHIADPFQQQYSPPRSETIPPVPTPPAKDPFMSEPTTPAQSTPYPEDAPFGAQQPTMPDSPDTQNPTEPKLSGRSRAMTAHQSQAPNFNGTPMSMSATIETVHPVDMQKPVHPEPQQALVEDVRDLPAQNDSQKPVDPLLSSPQAQQAVLHSSPPPMHAEPAPLSAPAAASDPNGQYRESNYSNGNNSGYGNDYYNDGQGQQGYGDYRNYADYAYDDRGRASQRSMEYPLDGQHLAAPGYDDKRLSVGFRPLPPDEIMDTEDPEHRANRIRSFYKEYFDENTPHQSIPPMPAPLNPHPEEPLPHHNMPPRQPPPRQRKPQQAQSSEYYEDCDGQYMGDGAYFDPDSKAFVMPYAQPVQRRAMTPPPRGPRMRGPPGPRPKHGMHGSVGGMSMPGGRGFLRPGSSMSSQYGPRPGSSASAYMGPGARGRSAKPRPPPAALTTLPNPAKLKDDTFALMSAADFAPPDGYKERAAGRSQSPAPERRPYQLNVPISSPLVSSYDELGAMPTPAMLGNSDTFTGLDFAPPKRFKDNGDAMSDAGSIRSYRSNKSGISAMQAHAIKKGAGRVSRLPGDTVFTQKQMAEQLKPSWNMRD